MNAFFPNTCGETIQTTILNYNVEQAKILIGYTQSGDIIYCVEEGDQVGETTDINHINQMLEKILLEEESVNIIKLTNSNYLEKLLNKYYAKDIDERTLYSIKKIISGYKDIYVLIRDEDVEEIALTKPGEPIAIIHRKIPIGWIKTNIIISESEADDMIITLARKIGKNISIAHPYAEGLLPEGHRAAITYLKEISRHGSSFVIRKHISKPIPPSIQVKNKILSKLALAYLWEAIEQRKSILIIGPTAAGKTTLLQSLLLLIPPTKRIVTIEDTPELNLSFHNQWDSLITRHTYIEGEGEDIDLYKLAKFALRRRADYIVLGEVRGEEAQLLSYAATSGHGVLATFHAETSESAIERLSGEPFNLRPGQIAALPIIVSISKVKKGSYIEKRRVIEIAEIIYRNKTIIIKKIFKYDNIRDTLTPNTINELEERTSIFKRHTAEIKIKTTLLDDLINYNNYLDFYENIKKIYYNNLLEVIGGLNAD